MNAGEAVISAMDNLRAHKLRSSLTMLGMIFGVGAVISMLSIGAGAERETRKMLERLGLQNVLVRATEMPDEELKEARKKSPGLSERDGRAILEAMPGVDLVSPRIEIKTWKVLAASGSTEAKVYGVGAGHAALANLTIGDGRFLDAGDERNHAQVCVIGPAVRRDLFGYETALGEHLKVNDVWCEVIGVLAPGGSGSSSFRGVFVGSAEREIYVPLSTATRKFERDALASRFDEIVVRVKPGHDVGETAALIGDIVDRLHGGAGDYEIVVPEALLDQSRKTQRLFNIVMGCIAGISLLVGGIGIMNIMLATVLERTREIGTRRALGARRIDIRNQFMVEAFSISVLGGLAGVAMGVGIAHAVAIWAGWSTMVTLSSIALSTSVSMVVGVVSGIYPATNAARLDPIDALRYE